MRIINRTKQDKEMVKAFNVYIHFQREVTIIINCILLVGFATALFLALSEGDFAHYQLIMPPLFWLFIICLHFKRVNLMIKRLQELNKFDVFVEAVAEDDKIVFTLDGIDTPSIELSFDKIKRVDQTKDYIFILTQAGLAYILKKDGFVSGSKEELIFSLRKYGIKVKGKV